VTDKGIQLLQS